MTTGRKISEEINYSICMNHRLSIQLRVNTFVMWFSKNTIDECEVSESPEETDVNLKDIADTLQKHVQRVTGCW